MPKFQSTRPRGARPSVAHRGASDRNISIHAPAWGATLCQGCGMLREEFQSTRPRGARHALHGAKCRQKYFNPRARVGRDTGLFSSGTRFRHFNPRARVGRDWQRIADGRIFPISIHAPAWGATIRTPKPSTFSRFQSTRPRGARHGFSPKMGAFIQFQSTRPRGARRRAVAVRKRRTRISIHAPAWGATRQEIGGMRMPKFQSTRPRGARLTLESRKFGQPQFQSTRPRGARHVFGGFRPHVLQNFNPRARVGRDCACLHGLNYSGCAIFFANLIFVRAVTGIFRRKVLCVIRVRTEILRPFSRRRCLLQHQRPLSLITWFCTDVLRFSCVFIAQVIETQAVFFLVNQTCQLMPQGAELCFIENAFKHGVLHALSVAHAAFCHFSQACAAGRCFRIDIVGHENQHCRRPPPSFLTYFHRNAGYSSKSPRKYRASRRDWA